MYYKNKYIKYKTKYLNSKLQSTYLDSELKSTDINPYYDNGNNYFDEESYVSNSHEIQISDGYYDNFNEIFGPVTMYVLRHVTMDKVLILLGDVHIHSSHIDMNNKIYLPDFLSKLFLKYSDTQFDFFTEIGYTKFKKPVVNGSSLIPNVAHKFQMCYSDLLNRSQCSDKYKNVRFHAVDIRNNYFGDIECDETNYMCEFLKMSYYLSSYFVYYDESFNIKYYGKKDLENILDFASTFHDYINGTYSDIDFDRFRQEIFTSYKIDRLSDNQQHADILNKLNIYISNCTSTIDTKKYIKEILDYDIPDLQIIVDKIRNAVDRTYILSNDKITYYYQTIFDAMQKINDKLSLYDLALTKLSSVLMDVYNLFRITKCDHYDKRCKNLLVLVGDLHNHRYLDFLTNLGDYKLVDKYFAPNLNVEDYNPITNINDICISDNIYTTRVIDADLRYIPITSKQFEKYLII